MAFGLGLLGMNENDLIAEGLFKDFDELGGKSDFWDEQDGGLVFR